VGNETKGKETKPGNRTKQQKNRGPDGYSEAEQSRWFVPGNGLKEEGLKSQTTGNQRENTPRDRKKLWQ